MPQEIDLRSDTVTRPTKGMLEAMWSAEVGDAVYREDPSVNALEEKAAQMFGMEAGLFSPPATMNNQIALCLQTKKLDEIICSKEAHIYHYEAGGYASNAGVSIRLLESDRGRITAEDVEKNINISDVHFATTSLVALENTTEGNCYDLTEVQKISQVCKKNSLAFHLDGARIFNALVKTGTTAKDFGSLFDTVSICLSKGLGAPVGAVLLGTKENIMKARRIQKSLGGGMRQAGYMAAAGIYALDNHIDRMIEDHQRASMLADQLAEISYIAKVHHAETNMVFFSLADGMSQDECIKKLAAEGIKIGAYGSEVIRVVTHLDVDDAKLEKFISVMKGLY